MSIQQGLVQQVDQHVGLRPSCTKACGTQALHELQQEHLSKR